MTIFVVGPQTWAALNKNPGPPPYPAPAGLAVGSVSLAVTWDAVTINGQPVASYTVQAVGQNGEVYVHETPTTNSAVCPTWCPARPTTSWSGPMAAPGRRSPPPSR
jgi:hypothetical protein